MSSSIAIIGANEAGIGVARTLVLGSVSSEILLVDEDSSARDSLVRDLSDVAYRQDSSTGIYAGTFEEAGQCDIVVLTTGAKHKPGDSRVEYITQNTASLRVAIEAIRPFAGDTIVVVASEPSDILTSYAQELSGLPTSQVIGSGTFLATIRLRRLLGAKIDVASSSINAYALGEAGDAQFVAWSSASVGGVPIDDALLPQIIDHTEFAEHLKTANHHDLQSEKTTAFGIGSAVSGICSSILYDRHNICPVSHFQEHLSCCLSLPAVLGRAGVLQTLSPPFTSEERTCLARSAKTLKAEILALSAQWLVMTSA